MEISSSNIIFIKLQRMRKCRERSAVLADGVKAPLSLTSRRKTKQQEQLTTEITMKLFQSIWNTIHQNQGRRVYRLEKKTSCATERKRSV